MRKTIVIAGMALWTIVAALLIWFLIANINGGNVEMFGLRFGVSAQAALLKEEVISAEVVKNIYVESSRHDVIFKESDGGFRVVQYGAENTPSEWLFNMSNDGGTLRIEISSDLRGMVGIHLAREIVEIHVPRNWSGNVDAVTSSGALHLEDEFDWADVSLKASSGRVKLPGIRCENLSIKTSSGAVKFEGRVTAAEAVLETSSGKIDVSGLAADSFDVKASSGRIDIEALSGSGHLKASSGGITAALLEPVGDLTAECNSGRIKLTVPAEMSFTFEGKTNSGRINTDFETFYSDARGNNAFAEVGENPETHIRVSTTSGSVNIGR